MKVAPNVTSQDEYGEKRQYMVHHPIQCDQARIVSERQIKICTEWDSSFSVDHAYSQTGVEVDAEGKDRETDDHNACSGGCTHLKRICPPTDTDVSVHAKGHRELHDEKGRGIQ